MRAGLEQAVESGRVILAEPRFIGAVTTASIGAAVCAFLLRHTIGWPGMIGVLVGLTVLTSASIVARWRAIGWRGLLPVSLLLFLGWAGLSILWSEYRWATVGGLAYLGCFTVLGLYIALLRDTIQIVRSFGDVLRFTLGLSIIVEVVAGALLDSPISFLRVGGNLDELGPIQGIMGARNQLGIVAVFALITFVIELRTKSVVRGLAVGSIALATVTLLLTRSPLAWGAVLVVALAAAALYGIRRVERERRRILQVVLFIAVTVSASAAWFFRGAIVALFNAGGDLTYRLNVWHEAQALINLKPILGWGWIGAWRDDITPFQAFDGLTARSPASASNAFIDVWLQLGLVGLSIFITLVGLTFVRSWLLASRRRTVVYAWPALMMVALVTTAMGESSILIEFGWLVLVMCTIKAAQQLSWRAAWTGAEPAG